MHIISFKYVNKKKECDYDILNHAYYAGQKIYIKH